MSCDLMVYLTCEVSLKLKSLDLDFLPSVILSTLCSVKVTYALPQKIFVKLDLLNSKFFMGWNKAVSQINHFMYR